MKRIALLLLAAFFGAFAASAQDLIVKIDSTKIEARVIEISPESVRYKRFSNPEGPTYLLPTAEIHYIRYANGAIVNTSFVCSEGPLLRSAPDLYKILNDIHKRTMTVTKNRQIAYRYPDGLITGTTLNSFSRYGVAYSSDVGERVGHIDSQAVLKKSIFGGGYIVPRQKAAEAKRAALKAREEKLRQEILSRIKGEEAIAVRLEGGEEQ